MTAEPAEEAKVKDDISIPGRSDKTPRVLRLTYELRVPRELRRNIRTEHQRTAVDRIDGAVQAAAADSFPWAYEIRSRAEFIYAWDDRTETISMPKTEYNDTGADQGGE
jgi:hypothetical protein